MDGQLILVASKPSDALWFMPGEAAGTALCATTTCQLSIVSVCYHLMLFCCVRLQQPRRWEISSPSPCHVLYMLWRPRAMLCVCTPRWA